MTVKKQKKMGVPCMEMIAIQCPLALDWGCVFICAILSMKRNCEMREKTFFSVFFLLFFYNFDNIIALNSFGICCLEVRQSKCNITDEKGTSPIDSCSLYIPNSRRASNHCSDTLSW